MRIKGSKNAEPEGRIEGTISEPGHPEFGEESSRNPFGDGESGAPGDAGGLFTSSGPAFGSGDIGDGGAKTTGRKRGRPPGSKSSIGKLSSDKLAAARRKFTDTFTGVVGFGLSYYGMVRANKYKRHSPLLAQRVYACYQIPPESARSVGEPLADTFIQWFPQYIETGSKAIDPGLAVARMIMILQQTSDNERLVVEDYRKGTEAPRDIPTNGHEPTQGAAEEWQNQQQSPKPEEIHPG